MSLVSQAAPLILLTFPTNFMSKETLNFSVSPTDSSVPLKLSMWVNDQCCWPETVIDKQTAISYEINDEEDVKYTVKIVMSGKTDEHTKIDEQGNIVKDALLEFKGFELMGIDIDTVMYKTAKYRHNHNGHSDEVEQNFAFAMGCNGTVTFEFSTPVYMWLLENL